MTISPIHLLLATLLFVLGLSVPREQLGAITRQSKWVAESLLVRLAICLMLFAASHFLPATCAATLIGLTIVMMAPAAASSAGWSMQIRASESATATLILGTTVASAITAPLVLWIGQWIAPEAVGESLGALADGFTIRFVFPWIVLPTLLGITVRAIAPDFAKSLYHFGHALSPVILLLLNYSNGSSSLPEAMSTTTTGRAALIIGSCVALHLATRIAVHLLLAFGNNESPEVKNSVLLGTVMSNTGLALVIATMAIPVAVESHLAIIGYTFVQHFAVAAWVALMRRVHANETISI